MLYHTSCDRKDELLFHKCVMLRAHTPVLVADRLVEGELKMVFVWYISRAEVVK
jgi:hypothetical protein